MMIGTIILIFNLVYKILKDNWYFSFTTIIGIYLAEIFVGFILLFIFGLFSN